MGQFEPGQPRPDNAGRKAGTPNKRNQEIKEYADSKGVSPANFLVDILSGEKTEIAKEQVDKDDIKWAVDTLMPYIYGKRKPVDADGNDEGNALSELIKALNASK